MAEAEQGPAWPLEKVPTGVPELDFLVDGGLTRGDLVLIIGGPGSGKTVLAEQMAFHWASQGQNVLWLVTLGEPNEKFLTHASQMSFYDRRLIGGALQLVNLSRYLRQGLQEQLEAVRQTIHSGSYSFVIIDGYHIWRSLLGDPREVRMFLSELSAELALAGRTLVVTADANPSRPWEDPIFAMSDGIIILGHAAAGGHARRQVRILKQRGRPVIGGAHTFTVDRTGMQVHPRIESVLPREPSRPGLARQGFGIQGLDRLLDGGLPEGSITLLLGSPGTAKSLLCSYFLAAGLRQGHNCLQLSLFEELEQFLRRAEGFDLPLRRAYDDGMLEVRTYDPRSWDPDSSAEHIAEAIEKRGIRRLVIDGIDALEVALDASGRTLEYMSAVAGYLRRRQVTTLFTREWPGLLDHAVSLPSSVVGEVVDNLIVLRYAEAEGHLRCLLNVVKTRYSPHSSQTAELLVEQGELNVVPHPVERAADGDRDRYYGQEARQHEGERLRR